MTDQELTDLLGELAKTAPRSQAGIDAIQTLSEALSAEPELAAAPIFIRGAHGDLRFLLPPMMLRAARTTGDILGLVAWFRKIPALLQGIAGGGAVKALYGVTCTEDVPLADDIVLTPFERLGPASSRDWLIAAHERVEARGLLGSNFPPRAALYRAGTIPITVEPAEDLGQSPPFTWFRDLDKAAAVLALVPKAIPIEAARWFYYEDPDVARLCEFGHLTQGAEFFQPGRLFDLPEVTRESVAGLLPAYRDLSPDDKDRIMLALQRLIRSRSQFIPGNRAIDLAIVLEVLFMNRDSGEHSHKISVRAARLLGASLEQRRTMFDQVRRLYDMRSSMVHTGSAPGPWKVNGQPVNAGELIEAVDLACAEAIRKLLADGRVPTRDQWRDRELS